MTWGFLSNLHCATHKNKNIEALHSLCDALNGEIS